MPLQFILSLVGLFVAVALLVGMLAARLLERTAPERKRLAAVESALSPDAALSVEQSQLSADAPDPALRKLSQALPRSPQDMLRVRRLLVAAGYYDGRVALAYVFAELLLPALAAGGVILYLGVRGGWMLAILAGVLGYLVPGLWLQRQIGRRRKAIQHGLPDALDLFVVCMEAGSSLDQSIVKASDELDITHPAITHELRLVTTEIRAGKPRLDAFKNLAKRTGVDDVRSLVAMLVQTDRFGTSVAKALRTHAANARTKRRQLAEERANKIGVKLVFPLVFCMFPGVYVVCIGPIVVAIYRAFL